MSKFVESEVVHQTDNSPGLPIDGAIDAVNLGQSEAKKNRTRKIVGCVGCVILTTGLIVLGVLIGIFAINYKKSQEIVPVQAPPSYLNSTWYSPDIDQKCLASMIDLEAWYKEA